MIDLPIHVSVDTASRTYRVYSKGKNVRLYNVATQEVLPELLPTYELDQTVPMDSMFIGDHMSFRINFPEDRTYDPKSDYYFVLNSLQDLVTSYRNSTAAVELSDKSNVVYLSLQVEVVNKGVDFLNKLMETYIEFELDKQQRKGVNTIEFIDKQIGTVSDSLQKVESSMENFRGSEWWYDECIELARKRSSKNGVDWKMSGPSSSAAGIIAPRYWTRSDPPPICGTFQHHPLPGSMIRY